MYLIQSEPSKQPFVAIRASFVQKSRQSRIVSRLFRQSQQLTVIYADTALHPLDFGTQHESRHDLKRFVIACVEIHRLQFFSE